MPSEWNATQNKGIHVHVESTRKLSSHNQHDSIRVTMSRERNRDTLKVVCMLQPRDALSVTSLMLKREIGKCET